MYCDGVLPPGNMFVNIGRMRATINDYAERVGEFAWHQDFRVATVQALIRRFEAYEDRIVGRQH